MRFASLVCLERPRDQAASRMPVPRPRRSTAAQKTSIGENEHLIRSRRGLAAGGSRLNSTLRILFVPQLPGSAENRSATSDHPHRSCESVVACHRSSRAVRLEATTRMAWQQHLYEIQLPRLGSARSILLAPRAGRCLRPRFFSQCMALCLRPGCRNRYCAKIKAI